jgi:hypothetical protein
MNYFVLLLLALSSVANAESFTLSPSLAKVVGSCKKPTKSSAHVWFFKQWHLGPKLDTTDIKKSASLPQEQNQQALYDQLDTWINAGQLKTVVAEGCSSGEMTETTPLKFNGWGISNLKAQVDKPDYDSILTSVPMKLEAKYGSKIHIFCGDDEELAKKNALAFSDARGEVGYLTRLIQYKDDSGKANDYLQDVIKLYHLPANTTVAQGIVHLKTELRKSIGQVEDFIGKRNQHLVDVVTKVSEASSDFAIVFGGAHTAGVKELLESKGLSCDIAEPAGYPADDRDEAKMIQRLKELTAN